MERTMRSVLCPDHNLRYDPETTNGCVKCRSILRQTSSGQPLPKGASSSSSSAGSRTILTVLFVAIVVLGFLHKRPVDVKPPASAYVDQEHGFAIAVPSRWKVVDPATVTYLKNRIPTEKMVATLISDLGRLGPTVVIATIDEVRGGIPKASAIPEYEKGMRAGWTASGTVDLQTEMATVDRIPAFHTSALATIPVTQQYSVQTYQPPPAPRAPGNLGRMPARTPPAETRTIYTTEKVTVDTYNFSGRKRTYVLLAVINGDRRADAAKAATAIANGFRVLERPKPYGKRVDLGISIVLGLALIVVIRQLSKS